MPLSLRIDVRTVPYAHFSITVCLRQQVLRELGTLNVCGCSAAGPLLATGIGGCSSANGALGRRPICPQNPLRQARAQNFSAARAEWDGASRRRRLLRGGGARKQAAGECKQCALAHSYSRTTERWSRISSAHKWRAAARCVHGACVCGARALFTHSQTPSLVAWQEERDVARRAALKKTAAQ